MHSARNAVTAVAISAAPVVAGADGGGRGQGTSLVLPAICKNLLATTHTHYTYEEVEEEDRKREKL